MKLKLKTITAVFTIMSALAIIGTSAFAHAKDDRSSSCPKDGRIFEFSAHAGPMQSDVTAMGLNDPLPPGWHRAGPYSTSAELYAVAQSLKDAGWIVDGYNVQDPHKMYIFYYSR
jgi:hypothetical protein